MIAGQGLAVVMPLGAAALLAVVAHRVGIRRLATVDQHANTMFAMWWWSASAVLGLLGIQQLMGLLGVRSLAFHIWIQYLLNLPVATALLGLVYYLSYLYTGQRKLLGPFAVAYTCLFFFGTWITALRGYRVLEVTHQGFFLKGQGTDSTLDAIFLLLTVGPVLVAVVAYGFLFFRVDGREQKYRIAMMTSAFLIWFGTMGSAYLTGLSTREFLPAFYQVPGPLAALLVLAAFEPPRWVRSWLSASRQP